jgi:ribonuclease VapC
VILDTSALVAILFEEPEAESFSRLILAADVCRLSVVSHLELAIVLERQARPDAARQAEAFLRAASIVVEPVTLQQGALARQACYDCGRSRHRARLNLGDCFATHWRKRWTNRCCLRVGTSSKPTSAGRAQIAFPELV